MKKKSIYLEFSVLFSMRFRRKVKEDSSEHELSFCFLLLAMCFLSDATQRAYWLDRITFWQRVGCAAQCWACWVCKGVSAALWACVLSKSIGIKSGENGD